MKGETQLFLLGLLSASALIALARAPGIEDLDGANFWLALDRYDLAAHSPHFPGYPVYLALAGLLEALPGVDRLLALQLPGLVGWPVALLLFSAALRRHFGDAAAVLSTAFLALAPLAFLTPGRAASDALGISLLLSSGSLLGLALPREHTSSVRHAFVLGAMLLAGLSLGVRLSYAPAVLGLAFIALMKSDRRLLSLGALVAGTLLWVLPFAWIVGPDLVELSAQFLNGHFSRWGGSIAVTGNPLGRALDWSAGLWIHGLAGPAAGADPIRLLAGPLFLGAAVYGAWRLEAPHWRLLIVAALPYALWLWLGQNPEKPRHLLPLLPLVALLAGTGLARLRPAAQYAAAATSLLALASVTLPLGLQQATQPSPTVQLAQYLEANYPIQGTELFCGQSERTLRALNPGFRAEYASDADEVRRRLGRFQHRPGVLLLTDEIDGAWGTPVATFRRDPLVHPHRPTITLMEVHP